MKKILLIGGAGYVGSMLALNFLSKGYHVKIYDLLIYQSKILEHTNDKLKVIKGDIRDVGNLLEHSKDADIIIHLACISNDPSFELDPKLGKSINLDCFEPFIKGLHKFKNKKFIYASSSSVYGLKSEKNVTEESSLEPLTDYSKFKAECEKILFSYNNDSLTKVVVRPATVCGYSLRQRLDVVVNIFANLAYNEKKIRVNGGSQLRPNIHINDMVRAYDLIAKTENKLLKNKIYNVGTENISLTDIAKKVNDVADFDVDISFVETSDNRSYHISSEKIKEELNFNFSHSVEEAVEDLFEAFRTNLLVDPLNNEDYFNIKKMNQLRLQ